MTVELVQQIYDDSGLNKRESLNLQNFESPKTAFMSGKRNVEGGDTILSFKANSLEQVKEDTDSGRGTLR